ncbi:23S rRNA (adenine(2030)-N(6))-methyltransferase RlmJ [Paenibacillus sp. 2KB_22]|uniref:23S rRNA (adenine(2030)-N(6))-methyltransferase RlmJ n=1 Tax=Paenibacillus sp. 2KB_22 TaxID=3232978 RepID=UPI003F986A41
MTGNAGKFADVVKHFFLLEVLDMKISMDPNTVFYDAFGGNYWTEITKAWQESSNSFSTARDFIDKANGTNMVNSVYYQLVSKIPIGHYRKDRLDYYWGSTKFAYELSKLRNVNTKLIYNSLEPDEVNSAQVLAIPDGAKIDYRVNDSFDVEDEYVIEMQNSNSGLLFFDPFFGGKRNQKEENYRACAEMLIKLKDSLNQYTNWSFIIWYPIRNKKENLKIQTHHDYARRNMNADIYILCDTKYGGHSERDINGVAMLVVNPPIGLTKRITDVEYEELSRIYKMNKSKPEFVVF